ncbi:DUF3265 domain-containing protein [Vibrio parahaemolyticus]|nr:MULTISPECIES: DUF3265 domain-containing protein [Vibrio]MCZ5870654.1 DUF3265 domain-containing protein [Vibrio parahaemolyticus]MCZ5901020.1 DUF3265 domain-containing protein [Vibrio parahaemolyticus]MCZ6023714.1 DUF3265 domain-containing protein [Vibrio parahaemolyticus]MCZ6309317.1 DUF3265 domain-containing protein [Vibrio parahaemolyticus]HAS8474881.1 DUF3265 domain-containing protein [Vibrio vulnificus]
MSSGITNALRRIRNAWRFWFDLAFVFTVQSFSVVIALLTT